MNKVILVNKALTVLLVVVIFFGLYTCVAAPIIASSSMIKTGFDAADRSILPWMQYKYRMPIFDVPGRYVEPNEVTIVRAGDAVVGDVKVFYDGKVESLCDDDDLSMNTADIVWFDSDCEVVSAGNNYFFVARQIDFDEVDILSRLIFFGYDYDVVVTRIWQPYHQTVSMRAHEKIILGD